MELTYQIRYIVRDAPSLFDSLLYKDERQSSVKKRKQIEESEFNILDSANGTYIRPTIISKLMDMRRVYYPIAIEAFYLPLSVILIFNPFYRTLYRVYELDYGLRILKFITRSLQYSQEVLPINIFADILYISNVYPYLFMYISHTHLSNICLCPCLYLYRNTELPDRAPVVR